MIRLSWLSSLWKFSRPHTIIGTSLSVLALYFLALLDTNNIITGDNFGDFIGAWLACLLGNIYIVGLNQLEDIPIDRINKPDLPLASGEFSLKTGRLIVAFSGILALGLATFLGFWLSLTIAISLLIGTAYSLPPIRFKRFAILAAISIFTVRGIIVNLGLFFFFIERLGKNLFLPNNIIFLTLFIVVFTIAIAIFKDIPDGEGDKQYQIKTFTLILGKKVVFVSAVLLVTFGYLGAIFAGIFWLNLVNTLFLIVTHSGLLLLLWWQAKQVNLENKIHIAKFYQFIWKLFFLEYLLFPTACWLNQ